ncbi:MAG: hypothetical protein ACJ8ER_00710 [Allosphingosinicella sp.]
MPDMLDEVAAISCETDELKRTRLDLFAQLFAEGKIIGWDAFLATRHPLKTDPAMIRALSALEKSGGSAVTFDIKPGSSYARKVALFYSQGAAFGAFVRARSCAGERVIGLLLTTYDPGEGLDRWLHTKGAGLCLPGSAKQFGEAFVQFMRHSRSARPATNRGSPGRGG